MTTALLAQGLAGTIGMWAIMLIVIAGIIGVVLVIVRQAGISIPPVLITVLWIVLAVILGVLAIKLMLSVM